MSGYLQVLCKSSLSTCSELSAALALYSLYSRHLLSTFALLVTGTGYQKDGPCIQRAQSPGKEIAKKQIIMWQPE